MVKDEITKEIENYQNLKWYESSRGKSVMVLGVIFLISFWHRWFLAILVLPIIYFVKKGSKGAMVLAGIYSGFLTLVNIAVYFTGNLGEQENFNSSMTPIYIYLGAYILAIVLLRKSYKIEKNVKSKYADAVGKKL